MPSPTSTRSRRLATAPHHVLLLDDEGRILLPTAPATSAASAGRSTSRASRRRRKRSSATATTTSPILDLRVTRFGGDGGLEVLREIRRREHRTSVIVLSAYMSPEVEAEARRRGAAAVLRKPQSLPVLAQLAAAR